ncbi:efflux transporter outer membrane subunit [Thalassotalea sediminis]|uniref:efflux transporter outer membrane subunit n=1 Tax=Thalassotalea sediminis TaxID=1759089 RepID=UPI002573DA03|nr:efflux transporter outer membrane subunit [Thalassotalea sediminis]
MKLASSRRLFSTLACSVIAVGCSVPSAINKTTSEFKAPSNWQTLVTKQQMPIVNNWVSSLQEQALYPLIERALHHNQQYQSNYYALMLAEQQVTISGATLLPELSVSAEQSRRKSVTSTNETISNSADINLQLSYEIDLWGKLSEQQRLANLQYASAKAQFEQQRLALITDLTRTWFNLAEAKKLLTLYKERAQNLSDNLEMMQRSYRLGLNKALDVYLAQNDVSNELARVAQQRHQVKEIERQLHLLIGAPESKEQFNAINLPILIDDVTVGTPSQMLAQRADIKSSWYDLLAADANLAIAHKARFPRLTLRANVGDNADELSNLLTGNPLAWSLIGGITAPIFNAGRLAAEEEKTRLTVKQKEQLYLQKLHQSLTDVESALSERVSLQESYGQYNKSLENALAAQKLAFEQYIKGLVTYSTVLEAQRRAFGTQTQLIQLTNQLIQNKITLHAAIGGNTNEVADRFYGAQSN